MDYFIIGIFTSIVLGVLYVTKNSDQPLWKVALFSVLVVLLWPLTWVFLVIYGLYEFCFFVLDAIS